MRTTSRPDQPGRARGLARQALFAGLTGDALDGLSSNSRVLSMERRTSFAVPSAPSAPVYVVLRGRLKLSRSAGRASRTRLVMLAQDGDLLDELSLLSPTAPRSPTTATALVDSEVLAIDRNAWSALLTTEPSLWAGVATALARRIDRDGELMGDLLSADVGGRVATALLRMAQTMGCAHDEMGTLVEHGLTQTELARIVGVSRESVSRTLSDFVARGWLRVGLGTLTLLDIPSLENRAMRRPRSAVVQQVRPHQTR